MRLFGKSKNNFFLVLLLFLGTVSWSLTMVKSGLLYDFGMGFWGPNGHDGVWHLALINQLSKFSLGNPVFAGEPLRNYHFFYDAFLAGLKIITGAQASTLYFQLMPPILAFLIGYLTYKFTLSWTKSSRRALWATFFVYFGGSFGWIVTLIREGKIGGESMFWANQAISTLINPPFAASLVLLLAGLILFLRFQNKPSTKLLFVQAIIFGILIQVKAYAGILALTGLAAVSVWQYFAEKKIENFKVFLGTAAVSILVFLPVNRGAESLVIFSPFWFPETMAAFPDRFGWLRLGNAIQAYKATGNFLKLIPAEGLALVIFLLGNFGTRILGAGAILDWIKNWRKVGPFEVLLLTMFGAGLVLPLLFIQRGNPWNTIQFLYYSLFFAAILAGIVVGEWVERGGMTLAPLLLLVGLTLPTTWNTLTDHYLPGRPPAAIPYEELTALEFLSKQPDGVVLAYPFDPDLRKNWDPPQPLWVYETTAYVPAISGKPTFLEDEMNLEITGYDWRVRRNISETFFLTQDAKVAREILQRNKVSYIYLVGHENFMVGEGELGIERIFENPQVRIYRVL